MSFPGETSIERPYGWVVAYTSLALMGIGFGAPYVVIVGLKAVAAEFGRPLADPSLCYGLSVLGAGVGGIVMGRAADRVGIFWPALLAACAIPLGGMLIARARSMEELWLVHGLVIGFLGNGGLLAPMLANIGRWFDRRLGVAVAVVGSGQSVSGMLWPWLFEAAIQRYGWRSTIFWFAVLAAATMIPLTLLLRPSPPAAAAAGARGPGEDGRVFGWSPNVSLAALCVAIFGCCVAMSVPIAHTVAFCTDLGFAASHGARMLSLLLLAAFISRTIWGTLADDIGGLGTILLSSSLQATALGFYALVQGLPALYALSIGFGLAFGGIVPTYAIVIREHFRAREVGWRIGTVFLFGTIGMAVGAWLAGALRDATGFYQAAFLTALAANVLNLAVIGLLRLRAGPRAHLAWG